MRDITWFSIKEEFLRQLAAIEETVAEVRVANQQSDDIGGRLGDTAPM